MSDLNPKKMKVAELKVELEKRNIQIQKGLKKPDLVAMLMSALESMTFYYYMLIHYSNLAIAHN